MTERKEIKSMSELPPVPYTIGDMTWNPTGLWRYLTPTVQDRIPPCQGACPAGVPIPALMDCLKRAAAEEAWQTVMAVNPLAALTGRLCYHPCQTGCLRRRLDRVVPIQALEQYVADAGDIPFKPPDTKERPGTVTVIGAGPAGLVAGYFLGLTGFRVRILDPGHQTGGFLGQIPDKRLPSGILEREVDRLLQAAGLDLLLGQFFNSGTIDSISDGSEVIVVDATAYKPGSEEDRVIKTTWAEVRAAAASKVIGPELAPDFSGFKPSHVAHAVGLGQELAGLAGARLGIQPLEFGLPRPDRQVDPDNMRFDLFTPEQQHQITPRAPLTAGQAISESGRCLSCGTCNLCQQCALFCPDACAIFDTQTNTIRIDLKHCKGCGICTFECPRGVITMEASK